jgi:hypothetical protein
MMMCSCEKDERMRTSFSTCARTRGGSNSSLRQRHRLLGSGFDSGIRLEHLREVVARHLLHRHLLAHHHVTGPAVAEEHRCAKSPLSDVLHHLILGEERLRPPGAEPWGDVVSIVGQNAAHHAVGLAQAVAGWELALGANLTKGPVCSRVRCI